MPCTKKQTMQNAAKQNSGSVASYDTQPGNEMGQYNTPEPIRGKNF